MCPRVFIQSRVSERVSEQSGVNLNNQQDTTKDQYLTFIELHSQRPAVCTLAIEHMQPYDGNLPEVSVTYF